MPTGRVRFFDKEKGFGFATRDDDGEDVFLPRSSLPTGVEELKRGAKVEFGVAEGRRGQQALSLRVVDAPPAIAGSRRDPNELHGMIEDMVRVLESTVQRDLRRGKHPDRQVAARIARVVRAVADELEA